MCTGPAQLSGPGELPYEVVATSVVTQLHSCSSVMSLVTQRGRLWSTLKLWLEETAVLFRPAQLRACCLLAQVNSFWVTRSVLNQ